MKDDGTQNYLVFQRVYRHFKTVNANDNNILSSKSIGVTDESINPSTTSNKALNPLVD